MIAIYIQINVYIGCFECVLYCVGFGSIRIECAAESGRQEYTWFE